ncbi:MAG TPA: HAD-IIIA family hydrolase [Gemmatimonadales bacterium]|nr:HAD-IIIA family hydrolase [Gemmatimonadales bacterium]
MPEQSGPPTAAHRAVFLDRDGTIVDDPSPGFLHEPGKMRLLPGAAAAIRQVNQAGWLVITVTNQSGIARRLYDEAAYAAVQRRLVEILAAHDARLDATYFCPHYPEITGPCECRKPGVKLFREAQTALGIDFARSYWVGDRLSDVEPARVLGGGPGRGILVATGHGAAHRAQAEAVGFAVVPDLAAAVAQIVRDA